MSIKILLEDRINKIFKDNIELQDVPHNAFEVAVAHLSNVKVLNGIDFDDLIAGILGSGGDEGIDLCYIFKDGHLINDDDNEFGNSTSVTLKLFQVKNEKGFTDRGFRAFKEGVEQIFDFDLSIEELRAAGANDQYIEKVETIRSIYRKTMLDFGKFNVEMYYVTSAAKLELSGKIKKLENDLKKNNMELQINVNYWDAQKLLDLAKRNDEKVEIEFKDQPILVSEKNAKSTGQAGFIEGNRLIEALLDENNRFRSEITDGNVRFFLGEDKDVNSAIIETALDEEKASNFWAMNNGITIIGEEIVPVSSRSYIIKNPQIVNGCQTVHCLYDAYLKSGKLPLDLSVFTKIVKTTDDDVHGDIIRATNSQNPVKTASLKANDAIQRNIEAHLKPGILYERRDNFYKKQGQTGYKVISLMRMAQIMHAVINKEGVVAANDIKKIFDSAPKYKLLFNENADYDVYKYASQLYLKIWSLKNSDIRSSEYAGEKKELISKGGFLKLHVISSLMMSEAMSRFEKNKKVLVEPFRIDTRANKNIFTKCKDILFQMLNNEAGMEQFYEESKLIIENSAKKYIEDTKKSQNSLFKNRQFDKNYIIPEIKKNLK